MKSYIATNTESGRLDSIAAELSGLSRSKIAKAIKEGLVTLNGAKALVKTPVSSGDTIEIDDAIFAVIERDRTPGTLDTIYEDDDTLVINKPAGLLVHDAPGNTSSTLVDTLIALYPSIATVGEPDRPGIVHRLDKEASGVLIVAKTEKAHAFLKRQFMDRETVKRYTVLVEGQLEKSEGVIDFSIERSTAHGRMAAKPPSQGGKEALTRYTVEKMFTHHTLCDVLIETGRTHQIRVHFFALKHPVAGDTLYRMRGHKVRDIGRLFLHARELTITLPSGELRTFTAPLPKELLAVLEDVSTL